MRKERDVKDAVKKILRQHGIWYCMPHGAGYGLPGIPDFICCQGGRFIGIETKFGGNKLSPHQEQRRAEIIAAGGVWLTVDEKNIGCLAARLGSMT